MIHWLLSLPAILMVAIVLAAIYLLAAAVYFVVMALPSDERMGTFTSLSPGVLSPLGVVFGLIVAFLASGIWTNANSAQTAVNNEASAMRDAVLLSDVFPASVGRQMRVLVTRQVDQDVKIEWPRMRAGTASIQVVTAPMHQALLLALGLRPHTPGQLEAQREMVTQLENALDARRERIIVSHAQVNSVKWFGVLALGFLLLVWIACIHATRRGTAAIALAIMATAIGLSVILLLAQDLPFNGPFGVKPTPLEHIRVTM